jgi:2-amino-4-hydroxy-6-hydroxymethyldihydropteridine diphosphokinase
VSHANPKSRRVLVALGSNLSAADKGSRAIIQAALSEIARIFPNTKASPVYRTKPVGCAEDAPDYVNACVSFDSDVPALEILQTLRRLETASGRLEARARNENRTLDLDIIAIEGEVHHVPELEVPHPRAHLRAFVLVPACQIEPLMSLGGRTIAEACEQLPKGDLAELTHAPL